MSRYTKLVLYLALSAAFLVGSFGVVSAKEIELKFFHCCGQENRLAIFNDAAREFEQMNPGVKIVDSYPGSYTDSVKVAIAGGLAPDVMWMGNAMYTFIDQLLPLNDLYSSVPLIKEIMPQIIQSHMWEGNLIAIPYGINAHAMFYNQNLFSEAGLVMPKDWTWDEALNMAKKLTKDTNSDGVMDQWGIQMSEITHGYTQGGDYFTPDLRKVNYNNPATIAAVQMYANLNLGLYGVHPTAGMGGARANFIANKVAFINDGVFAIDAIAPAVNFNWDVQLFPKMVINGKETRTSFYSSESWVVYKGTPYPDIAKKFVQYLMSKEIMSRLAVTKAVIPSQPSIAIGSFLKITEPKSISKFTDMLSWWKKNSSHPAPLDSGGYAAKIKNGSIPVSQAIPEMEKHHNMILDEYWAERDKK